MFMTTVINPGQKRQWEREKHVKDIEQPYVGGRPNERFAKMYQNEPGKLTGIYSGRELRRLEMPKLARVKEAKEAKNG